MGPNRKVNGVDGWSGTLQRPVKARVGHRKGSHSMSRGKDGGVAALSTTVAKPNNALALPQPPHTPPPRSTRRGVAPHAQGEGGSYVNENPRLVESEPPPAPPASVLGHATNPLLNGLAQLAPTASRVAEQPFATSIGHSANGARSTSRNENNSNGASHVNRPATLLANLAGSHAHAAEANKPPGSRALGLATASPLPSPANGKLIASPAPRSTGAIPHVQPLYPVGRTAGTALGSLTTPDGPILPGGNGAFAERRIRRESDSIASNIVASNFNNVSSSSSATSPVPARPQHPASGPPAVPLRERAFLSPRRVDHTAATPQETLFGRRVSNNANNNYGAGFGGTRVATHMKLVTPRSRRAAANGNGNGKAARPELAREAMANSTTYRPPSPASQDTGAAGEPQTGVGRPSHTLSNAGEEVGRGATSELSAHTRMLASLRQLTTSRLAEDATQARAFQAGVVGGDGRQPFALNTSGPMGNVGASSGGASGGTSNPGATATAVATLGSSSMANNTTSCGGGAMSGMNGLHPAPPPPAAVKPTNNPLKRRQLRNNVLSSLPASSATAGAGEQRGARASPSAASAGAASLERASSVSRSVSVAGAGAASSSPYDFRVVVSSGKTGQRPISLAIGCGCVQGMRPTMEDEHFVELNHAILREQPISLVGVLDGHCGRRVAELGARWLPEYFFAHSAVGDNNALALVEAILQADRAIYHALRKPNNANAGGGSSSRRSNFGDSGHFGSRREFGALEMDGAGGSTLIAAAVHGRMLYVACLGDARAVLYDGHTTIAMSEDHKPGNAKETVRIAKCGGFVQFGRVCGVLAVSRALGDFEFKYPCSPSSRGSTSSGFLPAHGTLGPNATTAGREAAAATAHLGPTKELMVSNVADVRQLHLTDESKFLLLACDGLWDVVSNEEATQFVKDFLTYTPDINDPLAASGRKPRPTAATVQRALNNCCQKLAEFAVDRGSTDNVSVMLLFFHDVIDVVATFAAPAMASSRTTHPSQNSSRTSWPHVGR